MDNCPDCAALRAEIERLNRELSVVMIQAARSVQIADAARYSAERELIQATRPLKRGERRNVKPTRAAMLTKQVALLIETAKVDGRRMTLADAARAVLTVEIIRANQGKPANDQVTGHRLTALVNSRLDETLRTIRKERRGKK